MTQKIYTIGARISPLAFWQAEYVKWCLEPHFPQDRFEIRGIKTKGDDPKVLLSEEGGKGLFIKEIEQALISKEIDFCVHSLKDMPLELALGCRIAAFLERGEVRDVLVSRDKIPLNGFNASMHLGTSSLRRRAQLRALGVKCELVSVRGNVDTRIRKVQSGELDGVILSGAGVLRLGLELAITHYFSPLEMVPAPGQGIVAVECREEDEELCQKLKYIHHDFTGQAALAERSFLKLLGGNCTLPLGAWAQIEQFQMSLVGYLSDSEGEAVMIERAVAPLGEGQKLGEALAQRFLHYGAKEILNQCAPVV